MAAIGLGLLLKATFLRLADIERLARILSKRCHHVHQPVRTPCDHTYFAVQRIHK